ncbi:GFA family protein [Shewanella sp. A32]|uniref:GFA family protein n=1 Tax=Shewanella sp. A32 TaxID=3031327 RepID=UPI0023B8B91F|nr:GFA family protein [Shewanella sp. A32]MDF0535405.1 GFA family protein [Shewanella sp. A32]
MQITRGSCLCGAITFEISGDFEQFLLCHCHRCQKDTGSVHAANLFSTQAQLKWLSGAEKISFYQHPLTRHQKSFCSICGAAIPTVLSQQNLLMVPAGCIDGKVPIKPQAHIFTASQANWAQECASIPAFSQLPPITD